MKKKSIIITLVLVLLLLSSIVLTGCHSTKKIDKFFEKVNDGNNYELSIKMTYSDFSYKSILEFDGNKRRETIVYESSDDRESETAYMELIGTDLLSYYSYTKENGVWVRRLETDSDYVVVTDFGSDMDLFAGKNFKYSSKEKGYVQKDDEPITVQGYSIYDVVLTIQKKVCTIKGRILTDKMSVPITITISNVGKTEVNLPTAFMIE